MAALSAMHKKSPRFEDFCGCIEGDLFGASLRLTLRAPFGREKSLPAIF